ncbi:MAG: phytanoyl-CoA dioxygenase family protein [Chitinophagales bacterium]|nr:phytanoyl-CoA dioxygenase family protein [Chitinophagales bacterium]
MMKPIFKDPAVQAFFDENGYVKLQLLNEEEVAKLNDFYNTLNNDHVTEYGFHVTMDNKDTQFVKRVINELESVILPKANEHFFECKMFTGSFVVKEPRLNSFVPPHQDWSFTDEVDYCSVTVWTALSETDIDNGAMAILKGSHKFFPFKRASPSPGFKSPFQAHSFELFPYMELVPMKPGEALIFDNRTIHASPPNRSDKPRVAAGIGLTQKEAQLYHYYVVPGSDPQMLEAYKIEPEFFFEYNNRKLYQYQQEGRKPEGYEAITLIENEPHILTAEELRDLALSSGNRVDERLDQYLRGFLEGMRQQQEQQQSQQREQKNDNGHTGQSTSEPVKRRGLINSIRQLLNI